MGRSPEGFRHRWAGPAVAFGFPGSGRGVTSSRGRVMASGGPGPRASPRSTAVTALLLLLLLVAACQGQGDRNAVVGGNITLVAKFTGTPTEINWKVNGDKYVDMELIPPQPPTFYRNRDRSSIEKNGRLTITGLNKADSGAYKAEALIDNRFQETDYRLTVYDPVSKPTINDSSTEKEIIVTCKSAESDVTYEWLDSAGRVSSIAIYVTPRRQEDVTLTCVVRNPASESRTSITIHPIPGPPYRLIVFLVILLVVLLIAAWCFWYFKYNLFKRACHCFDSPKVHPKDKKAEDGTKEEEERLGERDLIVIAMVGEDVTLVAKHCGKPTEINWKVNGDKYVDMELIPPQPPSFYRNKDRSSIEKNGSLTITNLTMEDAGAYKAEALIDNRFQETDYKLTVYENRFVRRINTVFGCCGTVKPKPDGCRELQEAAVKPKPDGCRELQEAAGCKAQKDHQDRKSPADNKEEGNAVVNEMRQEEDPAPNAKAKGNAVVNEMRQEEDPAPNAKAEKTQAANKDDGIEWKQETQAANKDEKMETDQEDQ